MRRHWDQVGDDRAMVSHLLFRQLENGCHGHRIGKHGHHRGFAHHHRFGCPRGFGHHHGFVHHKCSGHHGHHGTFNFPHRHEHKEYVLEMLKELLNIENRAENERNTSPDPQEATTSAEKETTRCTKCSGSRHWGRKHRRMIPKKPSITTSKTKTCDGVQTEAAMVNEANRIPECCDKSPDLEVMENSED